MSAISEDSSLVFFAEGDDAIEYLDLLEEEGEAAVIDLILGSKLDEIEQENTPEPEDQDDEVFEHDDGYVLVYNARLERVWLYETAASGDQI
jgi:hypothetical protein